MSFCEHFRQAVIVCVDTAHRSVLQTLQSNQQRHERDLYELKIQAEREALEAQLQMEENRQRVARVRPHLQMDKYQSTKV